MTGSTNTGPVAVFHHPAMLDYRIPAGIFDSLPSPLMAHQMAQPERPERIANTCSVLAQGPLSDHLHWSEPLEASDEEILAFHTAEYVQRLREADAEGTYLSRSTYLGAGWLRYVRMSAGAAIAAARHVVSGKGKLAYALGRPPSHHAQPACGDGYCFVNGVALAALEALKGACGRVATIDWDVHHGNGTQEGFYGRSDVLTISVHMDHGPWGPTHLQTGGVEETSSAAGKGTNLNLPLPMGSGDRTYVDVFRRCIAPAVRRFAPDVIILANGQDANQFDPNGRQCVTMAGFYALGHEAGALADELCDGRIIMTQEGRLQSNVRATMCLCIACGPPGPAARCGGSDCLLS